jgi:NADH:ubiquinone oxidoreductase subunit 4 (subunit M)
MLTTLLVLPLAGALLLAMSSDSTSSSVLRVKIIALVVTTATFLASLLMWTQFNGSESGYQFTDSFTSLSFLHMHIGVDGLSLYFVLLTTFTMPIAVLSC